MPRSIIDGFAEFLKRLTPSATESARAKKHRASIKACLEANFDLLRFFRTGSFGNGTSISGHSDVDYFASLGGTLPASSSMLLRQVRTALDTRFPDTGVRVTCPSVLVPFGSDPSESTEVVPADLSSMADDYMAYDIADCSAEWMRSSPGAHNAWVLRVDKKLSRRVRPLIRFIKAWKFIRNAPISSFYLEVYVTRYAEKESSIIYSLDIKRVLKRLDEAGLPAIRDPLGISGTIHPCGTTAKHDDATSKLSTAATRAAKAWDAEADEDIKDAFEWWDLLYDRQFPSYYCT